MTAEAFRRSSFDVIIVGGGVAGALVAHKLARAGRSVLVLEAGTAAAMDPASYRSYVSDYYEMGPQRSTPNGPYPRNLSALSPNDSNQDPYFVQQGPQLFLNDYLRMLGGSTLHWQGTTQRLVPNDFRLQSEYGRASDWPITYDDLEPFYREAEWEIGVSANVEDQRNLGVWFGHAYDYPMERIPQSHIDQFFIRTLGNSSLVRLYGGAYPLRVVSMPVARNSTPRPGFRPTGAVGDDGSEGGRCQGNSSCSPICPVQARYNALKTLAAARRGGGDQLEIRAQCVASRLVIEPASGLITTVEYKRYATPGAPEHVTEVVQGKIVVLAANAIENTVLALASGIVDRSGQLGRNLMDNPYLTLNGLAPGPVYPFRGPDITSGIESLRDGRFREKHAAFRLSIANWGWIGEPVGAVSELLRAASFGKRFREGLQDKLTRMVRLGVVLEQLPDADNRVTLDPGHTDLLGNFLPVLNYRYGEYSLEGARAAIGTVWPAILDNTGIEDAADARAVPPGFQQVTHRGQTFNIMGPGHVAGTHRMGGGASSSVVDPSLRSWAHRNLYMLGAGSMVTIGTGNPTLTAAALSLRAARQILRELE
jgi:choline dehydrogenase-like flavoprotein